MKIIFTIIFSIAFSFAIFGQSIVEKKFAKEKRTLTKTHFAVGEDATSGFDYVVYHRKNSVTKIRIIWSSASAPPSVTDLYFSQNAPILYISYAATNKQYKSLKKGTELSLKINERLLLANSKLIEWINNGKKIEQTDSRWREKEAAVLASFNDELESVQAYFRGEL